MRTCGPWRVARQGQEQLCFRGASCSALAEQCYLGRSHSLRSNGEDVELQGSTLHLASDLHSALVHQPLRARSMMTAGLRGSQRLKWVRKANWCWGTKWLCLLPAVDAMRTTHRGCSPIYGLQERNLKELTVATLALTCLQADHQLQPRAVVSDLPLKKGTFLFFKCC